jgi:hypothetical protein
MGDPLEWNEVSIDGVSVPLQEKVKSELGSFIRSGTRRELAGLAALMDPGEAIQGAIRAHSLKLFGHDGNHWSCTYPGAGNTFSPAPLLVLTNRRLLAINTVPTVASNLGSERVQLELTYAPVRANLQFIEVPRADLRSVTPLLRMGRFDIEIGQELRLHVQCSGKPLYRRSRVRKLWHSLQQAESV